jgi:hypothetical protein
MAPAVAVFVHCLRRSMFLRGLAARVVCHRATPATMKTARRHHPTSPSATSSLPKSPFVPHRSLRRCSLPRPPIWCGGGRPTRRSDLGHTWIDVGQSRSDGPGCLIRPSSSMPRRCHEGRGGAAPSSPAGPVCDVGRCHTPSGWIPALFRHTERGFVGNATLFFGEFMLRRPAPPHPMCRSSDIARLFSTSAGPRVGAPRARKTATADGCRAGYPALTLQASWPLRRRMSCASTRGARADQIGRLGLRNARTNKRDSRFSPTGI